jgi:two-component system sensor histidine kinase AlgZ
VLVRIERKGDRVHVLVENPLRPDGSRSEASARTGNHMALDNIRERLMLFFDEEAKLQTRVEGGRHRVEIEIPYRTGGASAAPNCACSLPTTKRRRAPA